MVVWTSMTYQAPDVFLRFDVYDRQFVFLELFFVVWIEDGDVLDRVLWLEDRVQQID